MRAAALIAAALAVLGVGVVACGGGSDADACGLVSEEQAEEILGTSVRAPEPDDESLGPERSCAWISRDSTRDPEAAVYGFFVSERDDAGGRAEFDRRRDRPGRDFKSVPVDGLGDAAYFVEPADPDPATGTPSLPVLYVRDGDTVLLIGTFDSDDHPVDAPGARRMQRAAARAALG